MLPRGVPAGAGRTETPRLSRCSPGTAGVRLIGVFAHTQALRKVSPCHLPHPTPPRISFPSVGSWLEPARPPVPPACSLRRSPPPLGGAAGRGPRPRSLSPAPGLAGLGQSGASTRALAFPLPEPPSSVWSPGAAEPVPEEKGRAGKGAILPGKGARQHIKESCSFLPCLVRKSTQIIKNIYTFSSWKRRVVSGFIIW